ncbi:MAG: DUF4113 domain-containing protein [Gemmatimonadaceae bacterium]|nr:DUF4113 domain-containing protein [Gloeobacterales cyanobacterium ES-bin-141]
MSLGAGRTKTLSKVAIWVAKKELSGVGAFALIDPATEDAVLARLPISAVWGIGSRWAKMLVENDCTTALQLRELPHLWVRKRMSVVGLRTVLELGGISCIPLAPSAPRRRTVMVSRSFGQRVRSVNELQEAVATFTAKAARKLRKEHLTAARLTVFAASSRYGEHPYSASATCRLDTASNFTPTLLRYAGQLVEGLWSEGVEFARAGVLLSHLGDEHEIQLSLFDSFDVADERPERLMSTVDALNRRHGHDKVRFAGMGTRQRWQTRGAYRSPRWTTRWSEVPVAVATHATRLFTRAVTRGGHA